MRGRTVSEITKWMSGRTTMKRMYYHPMKISLNLISEVDSEDDMLIMRSDLAANHWYKVIGDRMTEATYTMSTITDFDHDDDWTVFLK